VVGVLCDIETLLIHCSDAFDKYKSATGATLDKSTELLKISSEQYNQLSSLYFIIGGITYELTPNGQIWPRSLNSAMGGTADGIYLVISSTGSSSGSGLDFTNGYCFLYAELYFYRQNQLLNCSGIHSERFYSVYDTTNSRVGFATTEYTYATTN
jgi:saccharopepsin